MLDIECFSFLNRALEQELAPLVIMASNRGTTRIRGTKYKSPHGLPADLLDRVLIITTQKYETEDVEKIIQIRLVQRCPDVTGYDLTLYSCAEEDTKLTLEALNILTSMAMSTTLRYALNLISCAQV